MTIELLNIQSAYMGMYDIILEEIHPDIQKAMDSDTNVKNKLNAVTTTARKLIKAGVDTGMESDKPKKGSSRAVFFPKDHKEFTLDGVKTKSPTAVKIAFAGTLDKHHGESSLLGEDQNEKESDHWVNKEYGIHHLDHNSGHHVSNKHESGGILAPVFGTHPDNHHLEMGRVTKLNTKDLAEATKNKEFPKGLKHSEIKDALMHEHNQAHGQRVGYGSTHSDEHLEKVKEHPWVEHTIDMMHNTGMHPGDLNTGNMGIYHHPVTGKKHAAIIDWGFSNDIAKKYTLARRNAAKVSIGY
jgi:hypothetical protein